MTDHKFLIFLICTFLGSSFQINSQSFLSTNGKAIVNESGDTIYLKGMGLGGWMLQEGYMLQTAEFANAQYQIKEKIEELIGPENTELFYEAWLANHVRKIDIDSLKAWGFNSVRLPMHYNLFTLPIEEEPLAGENTWLSKGFELTDSLISWCAQNEMYVILDLHAAPGGQGYDQGISDYDPSKPSLWESQANRDKTVAFWKRLAERYVDEPWVAGYDFLNEPNWNLPGNILLRDLYVEITDSIRAVDTNHLIFVEGNWFANDFTGLTPPWDDNMVYSPHKYWSFNDQGSIQWVLDIRDDYDVPLFLGESGENSNVWFRDAIKLLEEHHIGWAWWPMKKIESIAGPLSAIKTPDYQTLLNYWNGTGPTPNAFFAKATLMEMAENLKLENCIYQKDVIDAMFRQVHSDEAVPYHLQDIPGKVSATDFDLGKVGSAYFDTDIANYLVSTGSYTAWNAGWSYRNDGVDIEESQDASGNGYNVGWIEDGEWMQYDVNVTTPAVYDIHVRVAAAEGGGSFHFTADGADISTPYYVVGTGGWQNWQDRIVSGVVLDPSVKKLRFYADAGGFNLSSFEFIEQGATTSIPTEFLSAHTLDHFTIQLNVNKPLADPIPASPSDFQILVNGTAVPIIETTLSTSNRRIITITVDHTFQSDEVLKISYAGNQIFAQDGTVLDPFTLKDVQNTVTIVHPVPGKVEAEDFFFQSGIQLENTFDTGGGKNIAYLDTGDFLDYYINVAQTGTYKVDYRTAAESNTGQIKLQLIDANGEATVLHSPSFPPTGDWQSWTTTSQTLSLTAGQHQIRIVIIQPQFNMNWFEFSLLSATKESKHLEGLKLFPNPSTGRSFLKGNLTEPQDLVIQIHNLLGQAVFTKNLKKVIHLDEALDLNLFPNGHYILTIRLSDGALFTQKLVKI